MEFGAALLSLEVPNASGTQGDVLLGLESLEDYFDNPACHGSTVGPIANRTDGAEMTIGPAVACHLARNDGPNQRNNLHTSLTSGLHKRVWRAAAVDKRNAVRLTCRLGEGELGLPGNRTFTCEVSLVDLPDDTTRLTISYSCKTDALTFVNMTNHSYFNLAGHNAGNAMGTVMRLDGRPSFCPSARTRSRRARFAPSTERPSTSASQSLWGATSTGTTSSSTEHADTDSAAFCIRGWKAGAPPRLALSALDPASGRTLKIRVSTPGAHLYTGKLAR